MEYMQIHANNQNSILSKEKWIAHQYNPIWELKNEENMQNHWNTWKLEQKWWMRWVGVPRWNFRPKIFFDEKKSSKKKNGRNFHLGTHTHLLHLVWSIFWIFRFFELPALLFTTHPRTQLSPNTLIHIYISMICIQCGDWSVLWYMRDSEEEDGKIEKSENPRKSIKRGDGGE